MAWNDLRDFLDELSSLDLLVRIDEPLELELEIGAFTKYVMNRKGPALLFENIPGCLEGFRLCSNLLSPSLPLFHSRFSVAMGLDLNTPLEALREEFSRRLYGPPIAPIVVPAAPCKEHHIEKDDIDLFKFPGPLLRSIDGGRYLGTWHVDIAPPIDKNGVEDWGMFRHMIHDSRHLGVFITDESKALHGVFHEYETKGKPMPMAVAIGTDPMVSVAAGIYVPHDMDEAAVAGALRLSPVKLIESHLFPDLIKVPASSEVVLEGYLLPNERWPEGDFGEGYGYTCGHRSPKPVLRVEHVTYRENPIFTMTCYGRPWDEWSVLTYVSEHCEIKRFLDIGNWDYERIGCLPPTSILIISIGDHSPGYAHTLASALWSGPAAHIPYIVIVEDDVDPENAEEVLWAISTRCHPQRGIQVHPNTSGSDMHPFLSHQERSKHTCPKILFDATFPRHWPKGETPIVVNMENSWPDSVLSKVENLYREIFRS